MAVDASETGATAPAALKLESVWLENAPPPPDLPSAPPAEADVVIIGAGYTGLNAALETARGGRSTVVIDAHSPGFGCSTRNGGQISTSVKPDLAKLTARYGAERARAIRGEGLAALEWIGDFISREGIDCDFRRSGRFHAAHSPEQFEALTRRVEILNATEDAQATLVPRERQRGEIGSDYYHGGAIFPRHACLHPAKYLRGLLATTLASGAAVVGDCAATAITRDRAGFRIATRNGEIRAGDVIVATNGYTSSLTPWLRRRVIPIGSYVIATEPQPDELIARLFPTRRTISDSRRVVYYYRASDDGRVVFGGRVAATETDARRSAPKLHAEMSRIFPELAGARLSHSWVGFVAYSFDELAHIGVHDGVHYAMGYCGSGVSMASYLGMRIGRRALGLEDGATAFDSLEFATRPFYTGKPWFLPAAVAWYRRRDHAESRRAARARD